MRFVGKGWAVGSIVSLFIGLAVGDLNWIVTAGFSGVIAALLSQQEKP